MKYTDCPLYGIQSKKMLKYVLHIKDGDLLKQGIPGQIKEKQKHDKNIICLPRQYLDDLLKIPYLLDFPLYYIEI